MHTDTHKHAVLERSLLLLMIVRNRRRMETLRELLKRRVKRRTQKKKTKKSDFFPSLTHISLSSPLLRRSASTSLSLSPHIRKRPSWMIERARWRVGRLIRFRELKVRIVSVLLIGRRRGTIPPSSFSLSPSIPLLFSSSRSQGN